MRGRKSRGVGLGDGEIRPACAIQAVADREFLDAALDQWPLAWWARAARRGCVDAYSSILQSSPVKSPGAHCHGMYHGCPWIDLKRAGRLRLSSPRATDDAN